MHIPFYFVAVNSTAKIILDMTYDTREPLPMVLLFCLKAFCDCVLLIGLNVEPLEDNLKILTFHYILCCDIQTPGS